MEGASEAAECPGMRWRRKSERGATAVEYAIMASLVAALIILSVALLGRNTTGTFDCANDSVRTQSNAC